MAEVLRRLLAAGGEVAEAVRETIRATVEGVDATAVAEDLFSELTALSPEDVWALSGRTRDGYVDPAEAAWMVIEDVLRPHLARIRQYQGWGMRPQAAEYCLAVLDALDRFDQESATEFKDHAPDDVPEALRWILGEWLRGEKQKQEREAMRKQFLERFPHRGHFLHRGD